MTRTRMIAACVLLASACGEQSNEQSADSNGSAAAKPAATGEPAKASIAEGLAAEAGHSTLVNALLAAGLSDTLSGAQPYTLFAPTDEAFRKLESGGDALLAPENEARLVSLLTGHIVPGLVTAEDLGRAIDRGKGKAELATIGGGNLTFTRAGGAIEVSGPEGSKGRLGAEKMQSNGAIHSIDAVVTE